MKLPIPRTLREASKRVGRAIERKRISAIDAKLSGHNPNRNRFEPFPIAITEANKQELMKRVVTPLFDMSYEEQLQKKESHCRNALREVARNLYKSGTPVRLDVTRLPCTVNPIVQCNVKTKWRNKDDFSVWRGIDGKTNTVGFLAFPVSQHGDSVCIEPNGCDSVKDEVIQVTDLLQEFIRNEAKLPVCYSLGREGGWRRFMIRSNLEADLMLVGYLSPTNLLVQQVLDERANFRRFVTERTKELSLPLKSLYFQPCPHSHCSHEQVPYELLHGDPSLIEKINDYKFAISPESYLTPNTEGLEMQNNIVLQMIDDCFPSLSEMRKKPLIIDLSCGIGVLAVHLANRASNVIGVARSAQEISDATVNAKLNDKKNCEFIEAQPEIVLEQILEKYSKYKNETLVICKSAQKGVHTNAISALKQCKEVSKIIYLSNKPQDKMTINNLVQLCSKDSGCRLPPFAPISATPIDAYPNSSSCDLVVALERLPE